jgi:hypothetical protein
MRADRIAAAENLALRRELAEALALLTVARRELTLKDDALNLLGRRADELQAELAKVRALLAVGARFRRLKDEDQGEDRDDRRDEPQDAQQIDRQGAPESR